MSAAFDPRLELYAITDQLSAQGRDDVTVAEGLLKGGATVLQYRAKKVFASEQYKTALALRELCSRAKVPFIVNDRVDLALAVGADGVHLGQDDLPLSVARDQAKTQGKTLWIGKSTHSPEQALLAEKEGADYIGFGPLFATQTKENNVPPVGCDALATALKQASIPVVAIGGIKPAQLPQVAAAGAVHMAVVTHLTGAEDIEKTTRTLLEQWRRETPRVATVTGNVS